MPKHKEIEYEMPFVGKILVPVRDRMFGNGNKIFNITIEIHEGSIEIFNVEGKALVGVEVWDGKFRCNVWDEKTLTQITKQPVIIELHEAE